jgi:hypothetical protein
MRPYSAPVLSSKLEGAAIAARRWTVWTRGREGGLNDGELAYPEFRISNRIEVAFKRNEKTRVDAVRRCCDYNRPKSGSI